jgi:hypothetical protein
MSSSPGRSRSSADATDLITRNPSLGIKTVLTKRVKCIVFRNSTETIEPMDRALLTGELPLGGFILLPWDDPIS